MTARVLHLHLHRPDGTPTDALPESFGADSVTYWWNGHDYGERQGYIAGWHWGFLCGIFIGAAGVALAFLAGLGKL